MSFDARHHSGLFRDLQLITTVPTKSPCFNLKEDGMPVKNNSSPMTPLAACRRALKLGKRLPQLEPLILTDAMAACHYANYVIKGRWKEAEALILTNPIAAYSYSWLLENMLHATERVFLQSPEISYRHALFYKEGRWKRAEPIIATDTWYALQYAKHVIKGRFRRAERTIASSPYWAMRYCREVVKGRFRAAEPIIATDPKYAVQYAKQMIKGRFRKAEPIIATRPRLAVEYARRFIKRRWPAIEQGLENDTSLMLVYATDVIKGRLPTFLDNAMIMQGFANCDDPHCKTYAAYVEGKKA
jgi:hypothetical protein